MDEMMQDFQRVLHSEWVGFRFTDENGTWEVTRKAFASSSMWKCRNVNALYNSQLVHVQILIQTMREKYPKVVTNA